VISTSSHGNSGYLSWQGDAKEIAKRRQEFTEQKLDWQPVARFL